jgi:glucosamine-6-phosphate deaminase
MKISIHKNYDEMSRAVASLVVDQVNNKPTSVICFPSGDSPAGMFKYLIADAEAGKANFDNCYFVGLDEWVGMGKNDDGSCTHFLNENFFIPAKINSEKVMFFDALAADLDASCAAMDEFINTHGPLDIMIVGVGMNGHIGLNEPGTNFNLYAHHSLLDPVTVVVGQKYFKHQTSLHKGITLGLKHLQEAKTSVLIAAGIKKAAIIKQALEGEVSTNVPASIFQTLKQAVIFLDEDSAQALDN